MIIENKGGPTQLGIRGKVVSIKPGMHNYANYPELTSLVERSEKLSIIASVDIPKPVKNVPVVETMSEKVQQYTEPKPSKAKVEKPIVTSEPKKKDSKKDQVTDGTDGSSI